MTQNGITQVNFLSKRTKLRYSSYIKNTFVRLLILIASQMRNPDQVAALTDRQEAQLLRGLNLPSAFQRKMAAHSVLRQLHYFLLDGRRAIAKRERRNGSVGSFQIL